MISYSTKVSYEKRSVFSVDKLEKYRHESEQHCRSTVAKVRLGTTLSSRIRMIEVAREGPLLRFPAIARKFALGSFLPLKFNAIPSGIRRGVAPRAVNRKRRGNDSGLHGNAASYVAAAFLFIRSVERLGCTVIIYGTAIRRELRAAYFCISRERNRVGVGGRSSFVASGSLTPPSRPRYSTRNNFRTVSND